MCIVNNYHKIAKCKKIIFSICFLVSIIWHMTSQKRMWIIGGRVQGGYLLNVLKELSILLDGARRIGAEPRRPIVCQREL